MKRRQFVEKVGLGSAALGSISALAHAQDPNDGGHGGPVDGALATASVSFGEWQTDPPTDRFPNASPGGANQHILIPLHAQVRVGGTVNFMIAGLHQVIVYAPGTQSTDIDSARTTPSTGTPAGVPLIDDPRNRLYRGLDPSLQPRDRVEVVRFTKLGRHLVICGVQGHFQMGMFGYVDVLP
jgi:plastocyanin